MAGKALRVTLPRKLGEILGDPPAPPYKSFAIVTEFLLFVCFDRTSDCVENHSIHLKEHGEVW
jgi:hypothetical protein